MEEIKLTEEMELELSNGKGDEVGTTFNGSVAKSISYNSIGAAPVGHTHTTKIEVSTGTS